VVDFIFIHSYLFIYKKKYSYLFIYKKIQNFQIMKKKPFLSRYLNNLVKNLFFIYLKSFLFFILY
jgi:hypothetical protein